MRKVSVVVFVLILALPLYAQNTVDNNGAAESNIKAEISSEEQLAESSTPSPSNEKETSKFLDFINRKAYAARIDEGEERKILRRKWKEWLGIDIFYPYFKAKEVEKWVRKKASIKIFKLRGRPKFSNDQIQYIFRVKF